MLEPLDYQAKMSTWWLRLMLVFVLQHDRRRGTEDVFRRGSFKHKSLVHNFEGITSKIRLTYPGIHFVRCISSKPLSYPVPICGKLLNCPSMKRHMVRAASRRRA